MEHHKSHINCRWKTYTLTKHFIEKKCSLENLKVTVIEKVKIKIVGNQENREEHLQRQLCTIRPHGMNVRKEFERGTYSTNHFLDICQQTILL